MELICKKCNKKHATSSNSKAIDLMVISSGMCVTCMKEELEKAKSNVSEKPIERAELPRWVVCELKSGLNHFRNDLLKFIPVDFGSSNKQICIKSSLHETTLPLMFLQGDHTTLIEWVKEGKEIHGMFISEWTKSTILIAPTASIRELRAFIQENNISKHEEFTKTTNNQNRLKPTLTSGYSVSRKEEYDLEFDIDRYEREMEKDYKWEMEQTSLQDALDEYENNQGHGLYTYDDSDDYDRDY